ncbi:MAG: hypothetical protein KME11_12475 [Timaviella obliquedivisa GSE-PSE-MK23-08B]|nr:hypothetical protein [Timaviella obliquedivisa GSE-PSE-MK23-08B]
MQGFKDMTAEQLQIQVVIKRLTPAVTRRDEGAIAQGIRKMSERYSKEVVDDALGELLQEHPWIWEKVSESLPTDTKHLMNDSAFEIMAETLTATGLRIEDHMRVSDKGVGLSKVAIAAIAATGYENIEVWGEGNETLEGMGLKRSPWWHPLSEFSPDNENMNLWASASLFISAALGWIAGENESPQARELLRETVSLVAPTVDTAILLNRCRYDDRALLKLTELVHRGQQQQFDKAFNR